MSGVVGSGVYVALDQPYVDVLVRFEGLGPDRYELGEAEISVVGLRSGDRVELGDRMLVTIEDVAVLRRAIYGRRIVPRRCSRSSSPRAGVRGAAGPERSGTRQPPAVRPHRTPSAGSPAPKELERTEKLERGKRQTERRKSRKKRVK